MQSNIPTRRADVDVGSRLLARALLLACAFATAGCVTENLTTGEVVPRGEQKFPFEKVEKYAEKLQLGMSKTQVMVLLGSPAEQDQKGDVWVYLPERYAVVIPARALRVEFRDRLLVEFGYRPIVLGAQL